MSEKDKPETPDPLLDGSPSETASREKDFFEGRTMSAVRDEDGATDQDTLPPAVQGEEELQRLLAPARPRRHPLLATVVILAAVFGLYWLWSDFTFFLRSRKPVDVGEVSLALKQGKLKDNQFVTLHGRPIMQSLASTKTKGRLGARQKKYQWLILGGTDYRVLVRARSHDEGNKTTEVRGRFTGRLRKLSASKGGDAIRTFYRNLSVKSPNLRPTHRVSGAELLRHVGQPGATLTDQDGKRFAVKADTLFELFVTFPDEYDLSIHADHKDELSGLAVKGGAGAPACPAEARPGEGRGGAVVLRHDPAVFSLLALGQMGTLAAKPGAAATPPATGVVTGEDRVVGVPPGTLVTNGRKRDCRLACVRLGAEACKRGCTEQVGIEVPAVDDRMLVAAGGTCGQPGEAHQVNLSGTPFATVERAVAYVRSLGHPFILTEDRVAELKVAQFVVRMPAAAAQQLIQEQTRKSPYNLAAREEVFRVEWRHLARRGDQLEITRPRRGYAPEYEVAKDAAGPVLKETPYGATLSLATARVSRADVALPLELPADAFLLEEGVKPDSMWFEPFPPGVPVICALFLLFVILNALAIRAYFRV
jgi:hypothetical protein